MWKRRHRWIRRLTGGLAFAALVVPTAQAGIVEDAGIGGTKGSAAEFNGYGYQQSPGVPVGQQNAAVRPDDRAVRFSPNVQAPQAYIRPDDRAVRFSPNVQAPQAYIRPDDRAVRFSPNAGEAPVVAATPSDGFSWSDAGIGAGVAAGAILLALGLALTVRHGGRGRLASA